jgi:agmatinase
MLERPSWGGLARPEPAPGTPRAAVLGLPYEGGICWRQGTAQAPHRLRELSSTSPAVSEDGYLIDPVRFGLRDLGDVAPRAADLLENPDDAARRDYFARVERAAADGLQLGGAPGDVFLLSIGGDHSLSIPLLRGFARVFPAGFGLVSLDAHPDLFDEYDGSTLSAACPMRRALELGTLAPEHLVIVGTRSYNAVELAFMERQRIRFVPACELAERGVGSVLAELRERLAGLRDVYLSVDIDVADPACAPGTGAPVAGGLSSRQLLDLVRGLLGGLPVRAMDLVEVSPPLDASDVTLFLALQVVFESLAAVARR